MWRKEIFVLSVFSTLVLLATNIQADTSLIQQALENESEYVIWQSDNVEAFSEYELAYITGELGVENYGMGTYLAWYTMKGKNIFGLELFRVCARGLFFSNGVYIYNVIPCSYARVSWWCKWYWSLKDFDQNYWMENPTGTVYAEGFFESWFQDDGLWAVVTCYPDGNAYGDGGHID